MFSILCYIPFILIFLCLSDGKRRQFGSSSMPPSLLKASPLAMNHLKKVSANILLSYLVSPCLWPGRCRHSSVVLAMGVTLPGQEIHPKGGEELPGSVKVPGVQDALRERAAGYVLIPKHQGSWAEPLGVGQGLFVGGLVNGSRSLGTCCILLWNPLRAAVSNLL